MSLLAKKSENWDSETFQEQIELLKRVLLARFKQQAFESGSDISERTLKNYNILTIAYWFAEDLNEAAEKLTDEEEGDIESFIETIPVKSHKALAANRELRQVIVYVLKGKVAVYSGEYGRAWLKTPEYDRIHDLLEIYEREFPGRITQKKFVRMIEKMNKYYKFKLSTTE
jgi:hypothetical protein